MSKPDSEQKLYFVWTGETLAAVFSVQLHRIGDHLGTDNVGSCVIDTSTIEI